MTDTQNDATEVAEAAPKKEALEIIRGRMPVALVAVIRFGDTKTDAVADAAKKFGTTVGKVSDIRANRNFAYVTESFVPTVEQSAQAIEFIKKHPRYDEDNVDTIIAEIEAMGVATEEEAKTFEEIRTAARGQNTKTKDGEDANAGGGNRRGAGVAPAEGDVEEDDLLA